MEYMEKVRRVMIEMDELKKEDGSPLFPLLKDQEVCKYIWECFDEHKIAMSTLPDPLGDDMIAINFHSYYTHLDDVDSGLMMLCHGGPASDHVRELGKTVDPGVMLPMKYLKPLENLK